MIAVIFGVWPKDDSTPAYLDVAADLRPDLDGIDGFISIERFRSIANGGKLLRVAAVIRDYGMIEREEAPCDSRMYLEAREA